ncbi:MATE family efflux transporter [Kocuria koreensis]|uniref:MATE family efflux transporter n=1 Tax=Rothia koreensis TaxID=592378 RepID=A0A7K1LJL3_9MICC|nr:MATE family efflux transporter [Rothia koreensis]MUN55387.1 MATE family efflux transporter [Rothia koreensis]
MNNPPDQSPAETSAKSLNRQILALALPAFGALISEPIFILADTSIVGHLGTKQLAGLSVASTVVQTVIGLMIFLSYSTTPAVARFFGARNLKAAYEKGRDGLWVALGIGVVLAVAGTILAPTVLGHMGAQGETLDHAVAYMRWSMPGLPGMLIVLAALGILRGLQDTRTPLYVASVGAGVNIVLNLILVFLLDLGVAGSAMGTSLVQWGMAAIYLRMIIGGSREHGISWRTTSRRIGEILSVGSWLMLRTASMRAAMLLTVFVVTHQGPVNLAGYQLTMSLFGFMAFGLDALAIAAQALLGKEMGSRDLTLDSEKQHVRGLMHRLIRWSLGFGVITGLICPILGYGFGWAFTPDPQVQHLFAIAMIVVAIGQPLASYVFILDGVLIGAQDVKYLALASFVCLIVYAPLLWWILAVSGDRGDGVDPWGFVCIWLAYAMGFMGLRGITLGWRSRSDVWIRA